VSSRMGSHEVLRAKSCIHISADAPANARRRLASTTILLCIDGLLRCRRKGTRIVTFSKSDHRHVPIYRARFRRRQLVARRSPYGYRVPPMERKQYPHKRHTLRHRSEHQAGLVGHQL
jgi:hypothetical protein